MNQRGAKLSEFDTFRESILSEKQNIQRLQNLKLEKIKESEVNELISEFQVLFQNLELVAEAKPKLVTYSKALHFLLPNLIPPMDRKYTLMFYFNNTNLSKLEKSQFNDFKNIFQDFYNFSQSAKLSLLTDNLWNKNIPKIIDNIIINIVKTQFS